MRPMRHKGEIVCAQLRVTLTGGSVVPSQSLPGLLPLDLQLETVSSLPLSGGLGNKISGTVFLRFPHMSDGEKWNISGRAARADGQYSE
jgi:hypothetical protein